VSAEFLALAYASNLANLPREGEESQPVRLDPPAWQRLASLEMPALFAVGDEDLSSAIVNTRVLADTVAGSEHHVFVGAAHIPSAEQPQEFTRVLHDWLRRHDLG
jgi:pimeloyl-ACP methyl ester carboxylesterase